ncbi:dihydroorotate dehydrogenase [Aliigemmobacter aestuarii]|uniref:Dihydroorotate dehydrogenase n=2 Tax=Aliigemmobacter aestuarii TaxID=1445661 RepID=A0A4S3MUK7_9RHOB|nr:dihydroorotate dehydrogenase [Gemmobacter aestuarii]
MTDDQLDDLFATARETRAEASPDFLARVLADAYAAQPEPDTTPAAMPAALAPRAAPPGLWARLSAAFGGSFGLAGVATAGLAGVWLGFAPPAGLSPLTETLLPVTATAAIGVDLMPGLDDYWTDEG